MRGRTTVLAMLGGGWLCLAAFAPPRLEVDTAALDFPAVARADRSAGEPYLAARQTDPAPRSESETALGAVPKPLPPGRPSGGQSLKPELRLAIDFGVVADSNVTNGSRLRTVELDFGQGRLPVPLDPNLREKADVGFAGSAGAGLRLAVDEDIAFAADAEGYAIDYPGTRSDDVSGLLAAGVEGGPSASPNGAAQLFLFERWYGGRMALEGVGLRASYRLALGSQQHVRLAIDARIFDSGFGEAFSGHEATVYLSYDEVLDPSLSVAGGVYVHREWLGDSAFSNLDVGTYAGVSHYLNEHLVGGVSAGISRTLFDEPFVMLAPERRRDLRAYGSAFLMARKPIGWSLIPSLTYSYNRTNSSILYYRNERHRLRFGLKRIF